MENSIVTPAEAFKVLSHLAAQVPLNEADHGIRVKAKNSILKALIELEALKTPSPPCEPAPVCEQPTIE